MNAISNNVVEYLKNTLQTIKTQDPDYPLTVELEELINKANTQEFLPLLQEAAEREKDYIAAGIIEDEDGDGKGFFSTLLDIVVSSGLSGDDLGRFWNKVRNGIKKLNRVNPATVTARTALRTLLSLNFRGYATKLKQRSDAYKKVIDLYVVKLGGKESKIKGAIERGAKKKPFFGGKGLRGDEELGNIPDYINKYIKVANPLLSVISRWIAQSRIVRHTPKPPVRDYAHPGHHPTMHRKPKPPQRKLTPISALRTLLSLNIFGYSSKIKSNKEVYNKVIKLYVSKGGKEADIRKAIEIGAKKRPIMAGHFKGFEGEELGVLPLASLIPIAEPFFSMISKWLGLKKAKIEHSKSKPTTKELPAQHKEDTQESHPRPAPKSIPVENTAPTVKPNVAGSTKAKKVLVAVGGGVLIGGIIYYASTKNKNKDNDTLKGVKLS